MLLVHEDDRAASSLNGRAERTLRPGAWLKEHLSYHFALEQGGQIFFGQNQNAQIMSQVEELVKSILLQALNGDEIGLEQA